MTKTEQAQEIFSIVMDRDAPVRDRREALEQLTALKRAAKVSFTKLGINEQCLEEAVSEIDTVVEEEVQETEQTDKTPRAAKQAQVKAILEATAEEPRREQVRRLVDELGITMYAAYYYARAYQPAK